MCFLCLSIKRFVHYITRVSVKHKRCLPIGDKCFYAFHCHRKISAGANEFQCNSTKLYKRNISLYSGYTQTWKYRDNQTTDVRLQNLPWCKTGLVSRQVLHHLSKLQNWICRKTGQYKTCLESNTKIEASIRATKPKPWQSHLTSETVEIFIQNEKAGLVPMQSRFWCGRLSSGTRPVSVQQV